MLLEKQGIKIFVFKEAIDMRGGFERLQCHCISHMEARMNEGNAYVFFGKNRSRLKILVYDGSGLVLIAKKIERKNFMRLEDLLGRAEITMEELRLIFHGSVLRRPVFGAETDEIESKKLRDFEEILESQENRTTQWEGFDLPSGDMNAHL
jgi:transposase